MCVLYECVRMIVCECVWESVCDRVVVYELFRCMRAGYYGAECVSLYA